MIPESQNPDIDPADRPRPTALPHCPSRPAWSDDCLHTGAGIPCDASDIAEPQHGYDGRPLATDQQLDARRDERLAAAGLVPAPGLTLAQYRAEVVAITACPACLVPVGERCIRLPITNETETLIREVAFALADPRNGLPDWWRKAALGRDMVPIARVVVSGFSGSIRPSFVEYVHDDRSMAHAALAQADSFFLGMREGEIDKLLLSANPRPSPAVGAEVILSKHEFLAGPNSGCNRKVFPQSTRLGDSPVFVVDFICGRVSHHACHFQEGE